MPFLWPMIVWFMWKNWLDPIHQEDKGQEGNVIYVDFKKRRRV